MPKLIDRNGPVADIWLRFEGDAAAVPRGGPVLLPLEVWREYGAHWRAHAGRVGVELNGSDDPMVLADSLGSLDLIAVRFARFTDGRGYSTARLLRERLGWRGELRATGDVLRDQLFYLSRCGFSSFALRDDQNLSEALRAFADFSEVYQAAADRVPLHQRRRQTEPSIA